MSESERQTGEDLGSEELWWDEGGVGGCRESGLGHPALAPYSASCALFIIDVSRHCRWVQASKKVSLELGSPIHALVITTGSSTVVASNFAHLAKRYGKIE